MSVMIRVSLKSDVDWAGQGVPGVHFGDALIDALVIFLSKDSVVLAIINSLKVNCTYKSIN